MFDASVQSGSSSKAALEGALREIWKHFSGDLARALGVPVAGAHRHLLQLAGSDLPSGLPQAGVLVRIALDAGAELEAGLFWTEVLARSLAGAGPTQDGGAPSDAAGAQPEMAQTIRDRAKEMVSSLNEALCLKASSSVTASIKDVEEIGKGKRELSVPAETSFIVQEIGLQVDNSAEQSFYWFFPLPLAENLAGGPLQGLPVSSDDPESKAFSLDGEPNDASWPLGRAQPRALVAGPVAPDVRDVCEALKVRRFSVDSRARLKDVPQALSEAGYDLVILVTPPMSLASLSLLRELAGSETPPFVVALRRATRSFVFQAARAGAHHVVVLPLSPPAVDRLAHLASDPHRAAA